MTGTVKKMVPERRFGFIRAGNGQEVFFHATAVKDTDFASLTVGSEVTFDLESGEKGPKAVNVRESREQALT